MIRPIILAAVMALSAPAAAPALAAAAIGQPAPAFSATDSNGRTVSLAAYKGKTVVVEWTNPQCPFVQKHYAGAMQKLQADARRDGVVWLTVNSEKAGTPGAVTAAEANRGLRASGAAPTAYLLDGDGSVARAFGARMSPQMYVINPAGAVVYMGAVDSIPSADPADTARAQNHVRAALAEVKAGQDVATATSKAYGCSIK